MMTHRGERIMAKNVHFHAAVQQKNMALVRTLLEDPEVDPNYHVGNTSCLEYAILNNDYKMVELLIDCSAEVEPLPWAHSRYPSPLWVAIRQNFTDIALLLIRRKAQVDRPAWLEPADPTIYESEQWSPLHFAVLQKNVVVAKALMDRGADPNTRTSSGHDAWAIADAAGCGDEFAKLVIDKFNVEVEHEIRSYEFYTIRKEFRRLQRTPTIDRES